MILKLAPPLSRSPFIALPLLVLLAGSAPAATVELTGPPGAEVSLDGRPLGTFPLSGPLELPAGPHVVRSSLEGYQDYRAELMLNHEQERLRWHVRPSPLKRRIAVVSSLLLAGSGQRYVGRRTLGWVLTGAEAGGLLTALLSEISVRNNRDDYLSLRDRYRAAVAEDEIERYRDGAAAALADAEDAEARRDAGLLVAGAAVVLGVLDAWVRFPGVAGGGEVPVASGGAPADPLGPVLAADGPRTAVHAAFQVRF